MTKAHDEEQTKRDEAQQAASAPKMKAADAGDQVTTLGPPVVTPAGGLEGPTSMVTSKAPEPGAPMEKAKPWTTQTPLPDQGKKPDPHDQHSKR